MTDSLSKSPPRAARSLLIVAGMAGLWCLAVLGMMAFTL